MKEKDPKQAGVNRGVEVCKIMLTCKFEPFQEEFTTLAIYRRSAGRFI